MPLWSTLPLKDLVNVPLPPSVCLFHSASSVSFVGAVSGANRYVLPSNPTYENLSPTFANVSLALMDGSPRLPTISKFSGLKSNAVPPFRIPNLSSFGKLPETISTLLYLTFMLFWIREL